eukprot:COSAG06_NODE_17514_length_937_cov_0.848449_3_plen_74_part_00
MCTHYTMNSSSQRLGWDRWEYDKGHSARMPFVTRGIHEGILGIHEGMLGLMLGVRAHAPFRHGRGGRALFQLG